MEWNWKTEDIRKNFHGVIKDSKNLSSEQLENKYSEFKHRFDKLYQIAIYSVTTGTVQQSLQKLEMMLKARENMQSGKASKMSTDMFVGNFLGKEYIYPLTQNPSAEDYKRAIDTITKKAAEVEELE
jgi:hypothetical protein